MVNDEEIKELVIARLNAMPSYMKLSIGGESSLSKEDMILHVEKGDKIGEKIIEMQLNYLRKMRTLV